MSEASRISPLLDGFIMGEPMRDEQGVRCLPALRQDSENRYIVKTISIPASQVQLDALLLSGALANELKAQEYFEQQAQALTQEVELLDKVSKIEGFLPYQATQTVKMRQGIGYEVCLLAPFRESLAERMRQAPLSHLAAVNLGLDMCAALAASRRVGQLYLNLKPSNIFITENRGYCIGDLGFIRLASLPFASYPELYRSVYTGPEIQDAMSPMNDTLDVYALGLTLYQVYNNGLLPFEGSYPDQPLPPPYYADYEMSQIILKACAPRPEDRWTGPAQMGQALVDYMQRNEVNDVPIIPPPVELPQENAEPEEFLTEEENDAELAELLAMIPDEEEPPQAEDTSEDASESEDSQPRNEDGVTSEVAQMLAHADDLIDHELPEPVMAPDPIDVPIPPPLPQDPVEEPPSDQPDDSAPLDDEPTDNPPSDEPPPEVNDEEEIDIMPQNEKKKKITPRLIIQLSAILLLLVALGAFGFYYYYNTYIQHIDTLSISGSKDQITVRVDTKADSSLLTIVCTDAYGNSIQSAVTSGYAVFNNMKPDTQYRFEVTISGSHKLTGQTTGTYTTGSQTKITNLSVANGNQDGEVLITFDVDGPDASTWQIEYFATDVLSNVKSFSGHSVMISGLNLGVKYSFRLSTAEDLYITGTTHAEFKVLGNLVAQNLRIDSQNYFTKLLMVQWDIPEGSNGTMWIVQCTSDKGFNQTFETTSNAQSFTLPGDEAVYTITLTAEGSSKNISITTEGMTPVDAPSSNPVEDDPTDPNPGEDDSADPNPGEDNPTDPNPGEDNPTDPNPGEDDPTDPNPGEDNPTNPNPGEDDPTDPNPGEDDPTAPSPGEDNPTNPNPGEDDPADPNPGEDDPVEPPQTLAITGFHTVFLVRPWNMELHWDYAGPKPSAWILTYTTNGGDSATIKCYDTFANIIVEAGKIYRFDVRPADDVPFTSVGIYEYEPTHSFSGNGFDSELAVFTLIANDSQDQVTSVSPLDTVYLYCTYPEVDGEVTDEVTITFSIRDSNNYVISANSVTMAWNEMWKDGVCKLEIPSLPDAPGDYVVDLFFDHSYVADQSFTLI